MSHFIALYTAIIGGGVWLQTSLHAEFLSVRAEHQALNQSLAAERKALLNKVDRTLADWQATSSEDGGQP